MFRNLGLHRFTAGGLLGLAAMLALVAAGCGRQAPPPQVRTAQPKGPEFVYDYAEARRVAREQGRPLLVLFTNRDCPCCRYMLQHALREPVAQEPLKQYVCVHVELETAPELCQQFRVQSFPTLQFLTSDGVAVRRVTGQMGGAEVATLLRDAWQGTPERTVRAQGASYTFEDQRGSLR